MKFPAFAVLGLLATPQSHAAVVAAYEFNTGTDLNDWTADTRNVTGLAVAGGSLNGTASNNDPQLRTAPAVALTPAAGETWTTVEFRVREIQDEAPAGPVSFNPVGLVIGLNVTNFTAGFSAVASGDDFFTVTMDISSFGSTAIGNFRLDPIGGASANSNSQTADNTFEVDYIRISDSSVVPEPSSALLLGFAGLALLRRRR